nr:MarR family transcriptional regulator [Conexibacter arvalis]
MLEFVRQWSADTAFEAVADHAGLDLDAAQFLAVVEIDHADGLLAGDLAAPLHMSASNVSKVLARLERNGLIERTTSSTDRRAVRVTLTAKGRRVAHALRASGIELVGLLIARWPRRDADRLVALLQRLMRDARAAQQAAARIPAR